MTASLKMPVRQGILRERAVINPVASEPLKMIQGLNGSFAAEPVQAPE